MSWSHSTVSLLLRSISSKAWRISAGKFEAIQAFNTEREETIHERSYCLEPSLRVLHGGPQQRPPRFLDTVEVSICGTWGALLLSKAYFPRSQSSCRTNIFRGKETVGKNPTRLKKNVIW